MSCSLKQINMKISNSIFLHLIKQGGLDPEKIITGLKSSRENSKELFSDVFYFYKENKNFLKNFSLIQISELFYLIKDNCFSTEFLHDSFLEEEFKIKFKNENSKVLKIISLFAKYDYYLLIKHTPGFDQVVLNLIEECRVLWNNLDKNEIKELCKNNHCWVVFELLGKNPIQNFSEEDLYSCVNENNWRTLEEFFSFETKNREQIFLILEKHNYAESVSISFIEHSTLSKEDLLIIVRNAKNWNVWKSAIWTGKISKKQVISITEEILKNDPHWDGYENYIWDGFLDRELTDEQKLEICFLVNTSAFWHECSDDVWELLQKLSEEDAFKIIPTICSSNQEPDSFFFLYQKINWKKYSEKELLDILSKSQTSLLLFFIEKEIIRKEVLMPFLIESFKEDKYTLYDGEMLYLIEKNLFSANEIFDLFLELPFLAERLSEYTI